MSSAYRSGTRSWWGIGRWLAVVGARGVDQGDGGCGLGRAHLVAVIVTTPCFGMAGLLSLLLFSGWC